MTPNTAELVAIYRHIKAHPEQWTQADFGRRKGCGTAFCVAGWAVARAGATLSWATLEPGWEVLDLADDRLPECVAAELLGLDGEQADDLFAAGNTLGDIRRIITEITGVDPEPAEAVSVHG